MKHTSIDIYLVIDTFLLLLIGVGPKIALVPFVEITGSMDDATKKLVVGKMLRTAGIVAIILVALGELLARLLHFSTGSLSIAGGMVLLIIIPYLLNPAGIGNAVGRGGFGRRCCDGAGGAPGGARA